jgi:HEAT repeat protein
MLARIIGHRSDVDAPAIAQIIAAALTDSDAVAREGGLAAVVSRAAGPAIVRSDIVARDWSTDHEAIQTLRPLVTTTLDDAVVNVRLEAIAALTSLDFDSRQGTPVLRPETRAALVDRFYRDSSSAVRAKIASGFSTDRTVDNDGSVRKLIRDALDDSDSRVRHAATLGAEKLGPEGGALLTKRLRDENGSVRCQAAAALARFGPAAIAQVPDIESALKDEREGRVQQCLQHALSAINRRR